MPTNSTPTKPNVKHINESQVVTQLIAQPKDANTIGSVFGGTIMYWMDMAAAICARRHSNLRVATVNVKDVQFKEPIKVGHVVIIAAEMEKTVRTSMSVRVKVQLEDTYTQITKVAALAQFLIVGLNESGKPSAVPALAETRNTSQ
ncbi:acyl-CoA thioesterase [candidate division KSB1 bacterium]|nr:acyl-CoA thioesterase [candidate division KSB1 bacterium]